MPTDTNIFPITGLSGLTVLYDVYKIVGLVPETPGYFNNLQTLIDRLSRMLKEPVTTVRRDGIAHIVIPTEADKPPSVSLTGVIATLQPTGEKLEISFDTRGNDLDSVRQRFLQFSIQTPLRERTELWQPRSGKAFFAKTPESRLDRLDLYRGASVRIVSTPDGSWGVCVDLVTKFVRSAPLRENANSADIRSLKGRSCLYQFGHRWFEVTLEGLADFDISHPLIPEENKQLSILDYVMRHSRKPVPDRLAKLDPAGAAIYYRTEGPTPKHAPAGLCFVIEDAHTKLGARHHREAILPPHLRKRRAVAFVRKYLSRFSLRNVALSVNDTPVANLTERFPVPVFEFGNNKTVGFGRTPCRGESRPLKDLGSGRLALISDKNAGFFSATPLGRQYLVLPRSITESLGSKFIRALKDMVTSLYPAGGPYDPILIEYDDVSRRNFIEQGKAIETAMRARDLVAGHALVMVHDVAKQARASDPLEAMIVKDFPIKFGLKASVIHTDTLRKFYKYSDKRGEPEYFVPRQAENRFASYLRNLALSKILMTSGKAPFVLSEPTTADIVIGIDVKQNTAALSLIAMGGRITHSRTWNSRKLERLTENQVAAYFSELVSLEKSSFTDVPTEIVVHRDGRVFESEIAGLEQACAELAERGILANNWRLTILEIKKTGPVTMRFFDIDYTKQGERVANSMIGTWMALDDSEGIVNTTGDPFRRQGTARPLHIIRRHGVLPIEDCLRDVFDLSCLSWSSPDNGSRVPISIKLCDRVLFEDAADYDIDAYDHAPDNHEEGAQT